jgi:hypothetical protein
MMRTPVSRPTQRDRRGPAVAIVLAAFAACAAPTAVDPIVHEEYDPVEGLLRIGPEPERAIPLTERGHTLLLPGEAPLRGLVVFLDPRRIDGWRQPERDGFDHAAVTQGVGVLHLTTGNPLDFLFGDTSLARVAARLDSLVERYDLADVPAYLAGLSLGGTRAARLAVYLRRHRSEYTVQPAALALVDAPLDMVRLWRSEGRSVRNAFHPAAEDEGRWVRYLLAQNLGGSPDDSPERYHAYSPFSVAVPHGGNAIALRDVPVRAYHEPDVGWWIANRRKSYYDMNSLDLAAFVNQLMLLGNTRAELVTTHAQREGYDAGSSPHTWSIVDDGELIDWFLTWATSRP